MKRLEEWLGQFDWGAMVGTALCLAFYLCVVGPVVVNAPALIGRHQEQSSQQEHDQKQADDPATQGGDEALATYTYWLVIFTAILALSTIGLWIVTAKTLRHAQDDARRQATDSRRQHFNAMEANRTARLIASAARDSAVAAISQLRPQVSIGAKGLQRRGADGPFVVWTNSVNSGGSTALKVQVLSGVEFFPFPLSEPILIPPSSVPRYSGNFDLPATADNTGYAASREMTHAPTADQIADWRAGRSALYVFGTLFYETQFGESVEVDYCQYFGWKEYEMWIANPVSKAGGVAPAIYKIARFGNETRIRRKGEPKTT